MDDTEVLTFEPWADPLIDGFDCHPESTYSRLGWLPVIGPSSWLVWGTLAAQLRREPEVRWELAVLAEAHGLSRSNARHGMVRRTLARLCQFRLLADTGEDRYLVRLTTPPLPRRQLERLPAYVAELHDATFARHPSRQAG